MLSCLVMQMTTTGYGDNVSFTMFARFACVVVMLLGTILVSVMTAACTEFLTPHQVLVTKHSLHSRQTKRVILVIVPPLQHIFRTEAQENKTGPFSANCGRNFGRLVRISSRGRGGGGARQLQASSPAYSSYGGRHRKPACTPSPFLFPKDARCGNY